MIKVGYKQDLDDIDYVYSIFLEITIKKQITIIVSNAYKILFTAWVA